MSDSDRGLVETGRFVAHPWYCDANAHLNTRFFQGFFDDATQHLLALCGHGRQAQGGDIGVVDARCAMEYKAEVAPGALIVVTSGFKALGGKSFTSLHEMRSVDGATLLATCEIVSVFFDLGARKAVAMTEDFRARASRLLVASAA
jgi:acyl-CoA thioester hydrolase